MLNHTQSTCTLMTEIKDETPGPRCACGKADLYETWLALNTIGKADNEMAGSNSPSPAEKGNITPEGARKAEATPVADPGKQLIPSH